MSLLDAQLTVCSVMRNESRRVAEFVASTRNIAWQTVIVDSGSSDSTMEIASDYGARVAKFESSAMDQCRNYAMSLAESEWVLFLDADERILAADFDHRQMPLSRTPAVDAWMMPLMNYFGYGRWSTFYSPRLFRKSSGAVWEGGFHETVLPSLLRSRARLAVSQCPIRHLEMVGQADLSHKRLRNIARLTGPTDVDAMGRPDLLVLLALDHAALGDAESASLCLTRARRLAPSSFFVNRMDALFSFQCGDTDAAIRGLRLAITLATDPLDQTFANNDLARVLAHAGRLVESGIYLARSYELCPRPDFFVNKAVLAHLAGNPAEAAQNYSLYREQDAFANDPRIYAPSPRGSLYPIQSSVFAGYEALRSALPNTVVGSSG